MVSTDVAIIGAGPYGLSIAAHLKHRGVRFRIFGRPMKTWVDMPDGMFLKSFAFATNIYTPQKNMGFVQYCRERGLPDFEPCTMASFAEYGLWVQEQLGLDVEPVNVAGLAQCADGGFEVTLESGETLHAGRVVVAVGITHQPRMPEVLAALPRELASHTFHHQDFSPFAGKDVCVVGAGQSALQAAALLHEAGATTRLLVRGSGANWSGRLKDKRSLAERFKNPLTAIGPGQKNWLLEKIPQGVHYLKQERRIRLVHHYLGPSGAWWLRDRVDGVVPTLNRCSVLSAEPKDGKLLLRLRQEAMGESELLTDHVVAGTGFDYSLKRIPFIGSELRGRIRKIEEAPELSRHFETSVPGLYFVGPLSTHSFGPLFRFVCGAEYTAPTISRHLARTAVRKPRVVVRPQGSPQSELRGA